MRFSIRTLVLASTAIAACASTSAFAETTLKVPFNFSVAGKNCPAGTYTVERNSAATLVTLKSRQTPQSFSWMVGPGDPAPNATGVVLSFNEAGAAHTLRTVQYGPTITKKLDQGNKKLEQPTVRIMQGQ